MNTTFRSELQPNPIAIVGMPGSGKSYAAAFFEEKGFKVFRFGQVIDEGIRSEGLEWTPENNIYYRTKIRRELGMSAVAQKMLPKIKLSLKSDKKVILDGLYSWEEYIYLRNELPQLFLLCIYAKPKIRYARLANRKDRPFNMEDAIRRDFSELGDINKAGPIAMADYLIKNELSLTDFKKELRMFWETYE